MLARIQGDGPEQVVGAEVPSGSIVHLGSPAGIVRVGQHQEARPGELHVYLHALGS
jgi:hypothetical protein